MARSGSYDFTITRDNIIADALEMVGNADASTAETTTAARRLNMLVKSWQAEGINLWSTDWITQTLSASSVVVGTDGNDYECIRNHTSAADSSDKPITGADYTTYWKATGGTGDGAVWAVSTAYTSICQYSLDVSIIGIDQAFVRRSGDDTPLTRLSRKEFLELGTKTTSGKPSHFYFDRQHTPQLYLYLYPENTTDVIHLSVFLKTQDFDSSSDNPDFSEEWFRALVWGLAADMAPSYQIGVDERRDLRGEAERLKIIARNGTQEIGGTCFKPDIRSYR